MSLSAIKTEVEAQLASISSTDTWEDVLNLFDLEIEYIINSGDTSLFQPSLEDYYPTADWSNLAIAVSTDASAQVNFNVEDITISGNNSVTLSSIIQYPTLNFWIKTGVNATQITGASGFDPDNISTGEVNLANGNYTDLSYNNIITGSLPGRILALDLGSAQDIGSLKIYDWGNTSSGPTYSIVSGNIVTSNDGSNWTTQTSFSGKVYTGVDGIQYELPATVNARYVGVEYTTGNNATYWVLSELEAFGPPTGGDKFEPIELENEFFSIMQTTDNFDIILDNITATQLELKLRSNRQ